MKLGGEIQDGSEDLTEAPLRSQELDVDRRSFLGGLAAVLGMASIPGVGGCTEEIVEPAPVAPVEPVEVEPGRPQIKFLGHSIEILDEVRFKEMHEKALQHLLLKFSARKKGELNEDYWKRAIEEDFHGVLLRMGRYETLIQDHAQSVGLDPDVLAYFGIEAGFNPLKRSPSGYSGLGQIGKDAVSDTRSVLLRAYPEMKPDELGIDSKKMNAWYDLRYDPLYGILYGLAYLKLLGDKFPETIQGLLEKYSGSIQQWLEAEVNSTTHQTRLDAFEERLSIPKTPRARYQDRYASIVAKTIPSEPVKIADPEGFAIHSYNMGAAGVAKLVFTNFLEATVEGKDIVNEDGVSLFSLNLVTSFDMDMGHALRTSDSEGAKTERQTYLWQAFAFKELMDQWHALEAGGTMELEFKGKTYSLVKPQTPVQDFVAELAHTPSMEVPVGLDLVQFAEHLGLTPEEFRLLGRNAAFVRAGAYYGDPRDQDYNAGTVQLWVPQDKLELAKAYLATSPKKVALYTVRKGDSAGEILTRIQKQHKDLSFDRVFWDYNRIGRAAAADLRKGDVLALPFEL